MKNIEMILNQLSKSKFRSSFTLKEKEINYIDKYGFPKIKEHAYAFIQTRLAPMYPRNDGKQTPYHGHPVFIAEHATATCCRECLMKWHKIAKNHELTSKEIDYIVDVIMKWIEINYERSSK